MSSGRDSHARHDLGRWPAFVGGATQPSITALLCAVFVAVLLVASLAALASPRSMASGVGKYWTNYPDDDYAVASVEAMRLRFHPANGPAVVVLGALAVREGFDDSHRVASDIGVRTGWRPQVFDLTTSGQSLWEMAALTDMMSDGFEGVIVLGVGAVTFSRGASDLSALVAHPRFGFTSKAFDSEVRLAGIEVPGRWGSHFVENRQFFAIRTLRFSWNLLSGPVEYIKHRYLGLEPVDGTRWDEMAARLREQLAHYGANVEANLDVVLRMSARLKQRGRPAIALLQAPVNPRFRDEVYGAQFYADHQQRLREFAAANGLAYWTLDEARLVEGEYYDWCHLRYATAQRRFSAALAQRIAVLLDDSEGRS